MKRIVVKIGTQVLTNKDGSLDEAFVESIVDQIAYIRAQEIEVILITSGAVAVGRGSVSAETLSRIPGEAAQKQTLAGIGQPILMSKYKQFFEARGHIVGQVLVTKEDFRTGKHDKNMCNCLKGFLTVGVIPIVNENDTVSVVELMFTDNDELAGLIALQLCADSLIMLTSTDGILDYSGKTIPEVHDRNRRSVNKCITRDKTNIGRGGMFSKFQTAKRVSVDGIHTYIVNGREENILLKIVGGINVGTRFVPSLKPQKNVIVSS